MEVGVSRRHRYLEVGIAHQHPDRQSEHLVLSVLVLDVDVDVEVGVSRWHQYLEVGVSRWHLYLEVGVAHRHPDRQSEHLVLSFLVLDVDVDVGASHRH